MFISLGVYHIFYAEHTVFSVIYDGYLAYKRDCELVRDIMDKKVNTSFSNISPVKDQTIILVIGESEMRPMMSLYGYEKNTTPNLVKLKDKLIVFSDVFSPHSHTADAVDKALTLNAFGAQPTTFGSVIDLFDQAGFEVYWISSPPLRDKYSGSKMAVLAYAAKHKYFLNTGVSWERKDVELLPLIKHAVLDPFKKKLIIVHLLGSHAHYVDRYPEFLERSELSEYENTVYATDYFMGEIITFLEKTNAQNTKLLYFSDHGESVECTCHTEKLGYPTMFQIPLYLWLSPDIRKTFSVDKDLLSKPYNTQNLIHSIADLAGVSADEIDLSKSIFYKNRADTYIDLDDGEKQQYVISSDLIFEVSAPTKRGKVLDYSKDFLKVKWYESESTDTYTQQNHVWKK